MDPAFAKLGESIKKVEAKKKKAADDAKIEANGHDPAAEAASQPSTDDGPSLADLRATVARLAGLDAIEFLQQHAIEAKNLGIKVADLGTMVKEARRAQKARQAEAEKRAKAAKKEEEQRLRAEAAAEAARLRDERRANQIWPPPFYENDGKIWSETPKSDPNFPFPTFVCGAFQLIAETTDIDGKDWGLLLGWTDRNGTEHQEVFARRKLHTRGCEIAEMLEQHGLPCNPSQLGHGLLRQLLSRLETSERKLCVTRSGWHHISYGAVFVLPSGEVFGPGSNTVILTTPPSTATTQNGTLAQWKNAIAKPAETNPRLALEICTSLAAPLLEIVGEPSRGKNHHGNSQSGKTTTGALGASVWGKGTTADGGFMRTWNTTASGFELIAREYYDLPLYLEEMTVVDPRDASQVIYNFTNQAGKTRSARDAQSAHKVNTCRGILCSTSELTLEAKMAERGLVPQAGQTVRLIEIPADAGKEHGVFDELPKDVTGAEFAAQLTAAAQNFYGTAGRAWIDRLCRDRANLPDLRERIEKHSTNWLKDNQPKDNQPKDKQGQVIKDVDGQVATVAKFFALIAAAGEMAIIAKILPWPPKTASKAAAAGFQAWIAERGGTRAWEETKIISQIRLQLSLHGEGRFTLIPLNEKTPITRDRAGYRDNDFFYILPEVWRTQFCKGFDQTRAAKLLEDKGWIERGNRDTGQKMYI